MKPHQLSRRGTPASLAHSLYGVLAEFGGPGSATVSFPSRYGDDSLTVSVVGGFPAGDLDITTMSIHIIATPFG